MKKIGLALVVFTVVLTSCSSDSNGSSSEQTGITFKVDGTAVTATNIEATLYTNVVAGERYIDVFGFDGTTQILEFHFPATTGSFTAQQSFDLTSSWLTYLTNGGSSFPGDYYHSTAGTINVTTCDTINNKIVATFNFTGNNSTVNKTITDGMLSVNAITHN
ncbi:MAG: hypothetical protein KAX93_01235 [Flavobacterium sp.]|nr:hypothetical protein [Flavobacterium sp.]MBP8156978.1 hypothetical protein [Flavobacterium sp.]